MPTLSEAIAEAEGMKKRGVVFVEANGKIMVRVLVACGELWKCGPGIELHRFTPDVRLATKPRWRATNDL